MYLSNSKTPLEIYGALLVGGAGRRTSIQHNRLQAAGPRFSILRWLSRICYKARRVGRSNPYAVAFWGVEGARVSTLVAAAI